MQKQRIHLLDNLRGITFISMILYHTMWDLVYIFGVHAPWYESDGAYWWQQSICWTFILLSGFCWSLGHRKLRRGLEVFGLSILISLVTVLLMPENLILFGVLNAIGTSMLVMIPLEKILSKWNPYVGLFLTFALFILTRNVNNGTLGFESWSFLPLPDSWYANMFTAYLGFPPHYFYSNDYFSVIPWIFLYQTGYFLHRVLKGYLPRLTMPPIPGIAWLGRHSLIVYALHQPIIYGVLWLMFQL